MINQLLVLGLVPGTNIQITFSELMLAADVCLIVFLLRKLRLIPVQVLRIIYYYRLYLSIKYENIRLQAK